jgi:hypothetical protein
MKILRPFYLLSFLLTILYCGLVNAQCYTPPSVAGIPQGIYPLGTQADYRIVLGYGGDWSHNGTCNSGSKLHTAWDLFDRRSIPEIVGKTVYASWAGTVKAVYIAGVTRPEWGKGITIESRLGSTTWTTNYLHVVPLVTNGTYVEQGQPIAKVMDMLSPTRHHLHFGIRLGTYSNTSNRGALPVRNTGNCKCDNDPVFPETFIDPNRISFRDVSNTTQSNTTLYITSPMKFFDLPLGTGSYTTSPNKWVRGQIKDFEIAVKNTSASTVTRRMILVAIAPNGERLIVWNNGTPNNPRDVTINSGQTFVVKIPRSMESFINNVTRSYAGNYRLVLEAGIGNNMNVVASQGGSYNPHPQNIVIEDAFINVSETVMNFNAGTSSQVRNIDGNTVISYSVSHPWIRVRPTSNVVTSNSFYGRNNSMTVTVDANTSSSSRNGTVTVTEYRISDIPSSYNLPRVITKVIPINQAGVVLPPSQLEVNLMRTSTTVPATTTIWSAQVKNNGGQSMDWRVETRLNGIATTNVVNPTSGTNLSNATQNIQVVIPENTSFNSRTYVITFSNLANLSQSKSFTYTQQGAVQIIPATLDIQGMQTNRIPYTGANWSASVANLGSPSTAMSWTSKTSIDGNLLSNSSGNSYVTPYSGNNLAGGATQQVQIAIPVNTTFVSRNIDIEFENLDASPTDTNRFKRFSYVQDAAPMAISTDLKLFAYGVEIFTEHTVGFSNVIVGTRRDFPLEIFNPNSNPVVIQSTTITGSRFSLVNPPSANYSLAPNQRIIVTMRFEPDRTGNFIGYYAVNYGNNQTFFCNLVGEAIAVVPIGNPILTTKIEGSVTPCSSEVIFPTTLTTTFSQKVLNIENTGVGSLTLSNVSVIGGTEFEVSNAIFPITLASGDQQNLIIKFRPTSSGMKQATLKIDSNIGSCEFVLKGEGAVNTPPPPPTANTLKIQAEEITINGTSGSLGVFLFGENSESAAGGQGEIIIPAGVSNVNVITSAVGNDLRFSIRQNQDGTTRVRFVFASASAYNFTSGTKLFDISFNLDANYTDCKDVDVVASSLRISDANAVLLTVTDDDGKICKTINKTINFLFERGSQFVNAVRVKNQSTVLATSNVQGQTSIEISAGANTVLSFEKNQLESYWLPNIDVGDINRLEIMVLEQEFSPLEALIGDLDNNSVLDIRDISLIKKAILDEIDSFIGKRDWNFISLVTNAPNEFPQYLDLFDLSNVADGTIIKPTVYLAGDFNFSSSTARIQGMLLERSVKFDKGRSTITYTLKEDILINGYQVVFSDLGKILSVESPLLHTDFGNKTDAKVISYNVSEIELRSGDVLLEIVVEGSILNENLKENFNYVSVASNLALASVDVKKAVAENATIVAFPNPTSGKFNLTVPEDGIVSFSAVHGGGIKEEVPVKAGQNALELKTAKGVYLISYTSKHHSQVLRLVVE